jgi:hypothetical protein
VPLSAKLGLESMEGMGLGSDLGSVRSRGEMVTGVEMPATVALEKVEGGDLMGALALMAAAAAEAVAVSASACLGWGGAAGEAEVEAAGFTANAFLWQHPRHRHRHRDASIKNREVRHTAERRTARRSEF